MAPTSGRLVNGDPTEGDSKGQNTALNGTALDFFEQYSCDVGREGGQLSKKV